MKASMGVAYEEDEIRKLTAIQDWAQELPFYEQEAVTVNGITVYVQTNYLREMLKDQLVLAQYQLKYWKEKENASEHIQE